MWGILVNIWTLLAASQDRPSEEGCASTVLFYLEGHITLAVSQCLKKYICA